ncbi:EthD family reductase [Mycobacterium sp. NPDC003449]
MTATLMVSYFGNKSSRFDRARYLAHHIPLVTQTWKPFGLQRVEVYFSDDSAPRDEMAATCLCHFIDSAALARALAAPETEPVMADISTFTDIAPSRFSMFEAEAAT